MLLTTPFHHSACKKPQEKVQKLSKWLDDNGCNNTGITLIDKVDSEISTYSARFLAPSEVTLDIPKALMMSSKMARCSRIGKKLFSNKSVVLHKKSLLAAYLLQERSDASSFWQPYIQSLPSNFEHLPIFFSPKEMETLHGSSALEMILRQRYQIQLDYKNIINKIPGFKIYSLRDYIWAYSVINTQSINICIDGEYEYAIGPLFNKPNYGLTANTSWREKDDNTIQIIADTHILPGDELNTLYAYKNVQEYVCKYGHFPEDISKLESRITLSLHPSEPHYALKLVALSGKHSQQITLRPIFDESLEHCLTQLRILAIDEEHKHFPATNFTSALTIENEVKTLNKLRSACQRSLRCYHTDIKRDQALLHRCSIQSKLRPCIQLRLQEKQLLADYVVFCEAAISLLKGSCWRQFKKANSESRHSKILEKYYQHVIRPLLMELAS